MARTEPLLTAGEKAKVAWYIGRMAKRGIAASNSPTGDVHQGDLQRKVERITDKAAKRTERDARTALAALDRAEDDLSAAKNAEKRARGGDEKRTARQARIKAQDDVRRAERAARPYL